MADRILVDGLTAPSPRTGYGREQVRAHAAFDFHAFLIPSVFLEGLETLVFLGALAFGLRASLFERTCPLAIVPVRRCSPGLNFKVLGRAFIEAGLKSLK